MIKSKNSNYTKSDISKQITDKVGVSHRYSQQLTEDLLEIIKNIVKKKDLNIKNFGTFKILNKKERIGRNPKTKEQTSVSERNVLLFKPSKELKKYINNHE